MRIFCFGYGYVARHLGGVLQQQGWQVSGTSRSAGAGRYVLAGGHPVEAEGMRALEQASHVLISIPPQEQGKDAAWAYHEALAGKWIGYLSTTGVYGDWQGQWVDENSPLKATEPRSVRRVAAEKNWLGEGAEVFRLAGIYGPQRNAIEQLNSNSARRVFKEGQFFSRIHVEDIVQVLLAAIEQPKPQAIYNLCDDEPAASHEVIAYAAKLLGMEPPPLVPFEEAELSAMAKSFYASNRRVKNNKIKETLGVKLRYPSYREGLASLLHRD